MSIHRIVLCLVLLTAGASFAQVATDAPLAGPLDAVPEQPEPSEVVPEQPESPAPIGEIIPHEYKPQESVPPDLVVPRLLLEVGGGIVGGVGVGLLTLLAVLPTLTADECDGWKSTCGVVTLLVGIPATAAGMALGVDMAGAKLGGRGDFGSAMLGLLGGAGAGVIFGVTGHGTPRWVLGLIGGPLLGAIVGYEISNILAHTAQPPPGRAGHSSTGLKMTPVVGTTSHGGILGGLMGRF
jgi:hypothetical protein